MKVDAAKLDTAQGASLARSPEAPADFGQTLAKLVATPGVYVSAKMDKSTLVVHAKALRFTDGDRIVAMDYRVQAPSHLRTELDTVLGSLNALAESARRSGAPTDEATLRTKTMRVMFTAERNTGPKSTATDVVYNGALSDLKL